jgi:RNA polymerase sigma-70 factor (ECF subfamily)
MPRATSGKLAPGVLKFGRRRSVFLFCLCSLRKVTVSAQFQPATLPSEMSEEASDETLMLRYRAGDADAFTELYERYKGALYRYFLRHSGVQAVAEELFQDIWLNIIRAREQYTVQAKFSTYVYRLAHNRLVDYYRRQSVAGAASWEDGAGPPSEEVQLATGEEPETQAHLRFQVVRLMELLHTLPEVQREAFLLREEAGMSVEEIAAATGVERETAKSRLRYAINRLRRGLLGEE